MCLAHSKHAVTANFKLLSSQAYWVTRGEVLFYSQDPVPDQNLSESTICVLGLPWVIPNLSLSIVTLTMNPVTLCCCFPIQQGPPDLAAKAVQDLLPCTPTLSPTVPAGTPGTWDHRS